MTYKHIEASRNARLWITQVMIPTATIVTTTLIAFPKTGHTIAKKAIDVKNTIKNKFNKKESTDSNRVVISIDAKNQQEALKALEILAKEIFESPYTNQSIKKTIQTKDYRKV